MKLKIKGNITAIGSTHNYGEVFAAFDITKKVNGTDVEAVPYVFLNEQDLAAYTSGAKGVRPQPTSLVALMKQEKTQAGLALRGIQLTTETQAEIEIQSALVQLLESKGFAVEVIA